jgi:adenylate cyclase
LAVTARGRRRLFFSLVIAAVVGGVFALAFLTRFLPALDQLQELATDATIFRPREGNVARRVALVEIDERTVAELRGPYGRVFSWPRSLHAQVLRNLAAAGARVVVFDLLFDSLGCPADGGQSGQGGCPGDADLAAAIAEVSATEGGTRVVLAMSGNPPEVGSQPAPGPYRFADAIVPLPALTAAGASTGHVQAAPDADGTLRRLPLVVAVRGAPVPALSLQAAAAFLRRPRAFDALEPRSVLFAGRQIPTDDHVQTRVNYAGPPSHRPALLGPPTVPGVSYLDVLNGGFDQSVVADKVVVVGVTAVGFADDFWVPTSRAGVKMPGAEIHAQAAEMLLQGSFLTDQGALSTVLTILALSLLTGAVLARWQPVLAGLTALGCFFLYVLLAIFYGLSSEQQVQQSTTFTILNDAYAGAAMLGTTLAVLLYRIVFEQAEQRATRSAMGKYLSPSVLEEVMKDPAGLHLGGQRREMTVLFSDIRGFTTLSEQIDPERLVLFLNGYLTAMTDIVFAQEGVLDKYRGDGIMAFWGAPRDQPDHALRACRAAYAMVQRLRGLQEEWSAQGLPRLSIGVGINSGVMTVGNVGSKQRFDYTAVGDAVNLAARLEEANKEYRTPIIVGEQTRRLVAGEFATRSLDLVALRGREAPTAIHELLGPLVEAPRLLQAGYLAAWEEAIAAFRAGHFSRAREGFARCLEARPDDVPAQLYLERCARRLSEERIAR